MTATALRERDASALHLMIEAMKPPMLTIPEARP